MKRYVNLSVSAISTAGPQGEVLSISWNRQRESVLLCSLARGRAGWAFFFSLLFCSLQVLRSLGYINEGGAVELKGSVARQISNHELLLTQLLLDNALTDLRPEEIVALLSCTVCQVRTQVEPQLPSVLQKVSG